MERKKLPRLNFRPLLFAACALVFGIILYDNLHRHAFSYSAWALWAIIFLLSLSPFEKKRMLCVVFGFAICSLVGFGCMANYTINYESGFAGGDAVLSGTVTSFSGKDGYSIVVLDDISIDGSPLHGKCTVTLSTEDLRTGDIILLNGTIEHLSAEAETAGRYYFASNIRYSAHKCTFQKIGEAKNPFLAFNRTIYDCLHEHMQKDEADIAYALLTGSSGGMDGDLMNAIRQSGIAHVFAVSGLHIGIVFGAVSFCLKKCGKWKFIPAALVAIGFSALCGFTVSSLRAVIMCTVFGLQRMLGRKTDFLQSIGLSAICVLLLFPAQWFAVGFQLSFGACMGLALFSGSLQRLLCGFPKLIREYLSATLAVQLFTFPVFIESFGYFSVWGTLLNLIVVPCMPVFFLCVLIFTLGSILLPFAATILLSVPSGLIALFLYLFQIADFSFVLTGFSLGAGAIIWLIACILLSERVRFSVKTKGVMAIGCALLFSVSMVSQNMVFVGCRITCYVGNSGSAAIVQTMEDNVLIMSGDISLRDCESFLGHAYGGALTAVIIVSEEEAAINRAAFLDAQEYRLQEKTTSGLQRKEVLFGDRFSYGALQFSYVNAHKLIMTTQNIAVEFDFESGETIGCDLLIDGTSARLQYYLKDGMIYTFS